MGSRTRSVRNRAQSRAKRAQRALRAPLPFFCINQQIPQFGDKEGGSREPASTVTVWDPAPEVCAIAHNRARSARSELCEHHYHFSASISRFHNLETKRAEAESLRALHSVVPAFLLWRETMLENRENCCSMYLSYLG